MVHAEHRLTYLENIKFLIFFWYIIILSEVGLTICYSERDVGRGSSVSRDRTCSSQRDGTLLEMDHRNHP